MPSHDEFPPETIDERIEHLTNLTPGQSPLADRDDAALVQALRQLYHVPLSEADRASLERTRQRLLRAQGHRQPDRQIVSGSLESGNGSLPRGRERGKRSTVVRAVSVLAAVLLIGVLLGSWFFVLNTVGKHQPSRQHQTSASKPAGATSTASPIVFPPSIYPPPHPPIGPGSISWIPNAPFTPCPSLSGLQTPARGVQQGILDSLNGLLFARSELQAQTYADRAAWPFVAYWWRMGSPQPKAALSPADVEITPALGSVYARAYQPLCGTRILADSWVAIWCTSITSGFPTTPSMCLQKQPDITNYFYFLDRNGHWLLWGVPH
jgi:hypothetical protein